MIDEKASLENKKDIFEEIEDDLNINHTNLNSKIFEVPKLHSKYLKHFFREKKKMHKMEKELNQLYRIKYHYYAFDYEHKLDNAREIQFHVLADEEYAEALRKFENQKTVVDMMDRTLKKVSQLSFDIRNTIEYLKYINGV